MVGQGQAHSPKVNKFSYGRKALYERGIRLILALQTTTFSAFGGIPTYNRCMCRILNDIENGPVVSVLIAMDSTPDVETQQLRHQKLNLAGFNGNRIRFLYRALRIGVKRELD